MRADRVWMYNRRDSSRKGLSLKFLEGVDEFIAFVTSQPQLVSNGQIRCPCPKCDNRRFVDIEYVKVHLYRNGFVPNYDQWTYHGEPLYHDNVECDFANDREDVVECDRQDGVDVALENPYRRMIIDAAGPSFDPNINLNVDEHPNQDAQQFYDLLIAAEEPLYVGCAAHTPLSAISRLLNIKSEFNLSESCYNRLLQLLKELLPKDAKLPTDYYKTKQMVAKLGLKYEKIDACENGCMLYYKENKERRDCVVCGHARYKPRNGDDVRKKEIPYKILRYFPLTPRLQRLYMSTKTAGHMTWHHKTRREVGVMCHPCDGEAWNHFNECYPSFASEPRNVRLGLSTDGFTPYGQSAHPYSCWPIIVTPYNLPPGMCMKTPYMFLTLVIPGPRNPGQKIDVYLQPLIDELKHLWEVGALTYDSFMKQNFQMRVALFWTINDFPAYGMLSGWSTHGLMSCPICMEHSKAFRLKEGQKTSFFDCHRQFLPPNHQFRRDKKSFRKGCDEKSRAPQRLSSDDLWERVCNLPRIMEKTDGEKLPGFGCDHNWTKRSIFWDLPYWNTNLIQHNLDVMHIEKNVFDNIFSTIMDVKGKTKDNVKSRRDLAMICNRRELELVDQDDGKIVMPKATYTLTKDQRKLLCEWVKNLRLPDGCASNLSRCVDMQDLKLSRMKSHDCHVFLERLLPIAFRDLLPEVVWNALTEVSIFFRDICSTVISIEQMQRLEENIVVTLCKLERIFPPSFFDSMEHLPVHLPYEARVGGPVQYRWMYPFERFLHHLKKKVKNKARVEGSICEAYLVEETSTFCSHYFEPQVQTRLTKVDRNDDGGEVNCPDGCLSIFTHPGRPGGRESTRYLTEAEFNAATIYVLLNSDEIQPLLRIFEEQLKQEIPHLIDQEIETKTTNEFAKWLKEYVFDPTNNVNDFRIKDLVFGPSREVHTWPQYYVNGYRFHTRTYNSTKSTMNSGVCIRGTTYDEFECDYYGMLEEVIELQYPNPTSKKTRVVLFKCNWFDPHVDRGRKVHDRYGLIEINSRKRFSNYEPFVLAQQAEQVYFAEYASRKRDRVDWWAVLKVKARTMIDAPDIAFQEDEVEMQCEANIDEINNLYGGMDEEVEMQEHNDNEVEEVPEEEEFNCEYETEEDDQISENHIIESEDDSESDDESDDDIDNTES